MPALRALRRIGDEQIAAGGYLERVELPPFKVNEYGWPSIARREFFTDQNGPINWSLLVKQSEKGTGRVALGEMPALVDLVEYVKSNDPIADRIAHITNRDSEYWESWLTGDCISLVGGIVGRAAALDLDSDDDLLALYIEREKAMFEPELPVDVVVPILLRSFDFDRLELSDTVRIERMTEATHVARASELHSTINPYLQSAALHAVVVSGTTIQNVRPGLRGIADDEELDTRLVQLAFQALEVASSIPVGYAQVLLRPLGWADRWLHDLPPLIRFSTLRRYPPALDQAAWNNVGRSITAAELATLPRIFENLAKAEPRVTLAARRLFQSDLRDDADDVLIDACIGIEALLGRDRDELTHRISQRAAVALSGGSTRADPRKIYDIAKKIYVERSVVVHGDVRKKATIRLGETDYSTPDTAWMLLRFLLLSALESDIPWTPADLDRRILDALVSSDMPDD